MTDPRRWAAPDSSPPQGAVPGPAEPSGPEPNPPDPGPLVGDIPLRPLGASEILDGAITNIRRNPRAVLGISLVITSAVQISLTLATYFVIGEAAQDDLTPSAVARSLGPQFVTVIAGMLLTAFVILVLAGMLAPVFARGFFGLPASPARLWRDVRARLPQLAGAAAITITLSLLAIALPTAPAVALVAADAPIGLSVAAAVIGLLVAFAVTIWGYVSLALAVPAIALERRGVLAALRRSYQLVRRRWWRAFGVLLLAQLTTFFIGIALQIPFFVAGMIIGGIEPTGWQLIVVLTLDAVGGILSGTLTNPFNAGVITLLYVDHRIRREGFDLELATREGELPADPLEPWLPTVLTEAVSVAAPPPGDPLMAAARPTAPPTDRKRP